MRPPKSVNWFILSYPFGPPNIVEFCSLLSLAFDGLLFLVFTLYRTFYSLQNKEFLPLKYLFHLDFLIFQDSGMGPSPRAYVGQGPNKVDKDGDPLPLYEFEVPQDIVGLLIGIF